MGDNYEENARQWEAARTLVRGLGWRWVPNDKKADPLSPQCEGVMECEIKNLPSGKKLDDVVAILREYGELKPLLLQGEHVIISVPCKLVQFDSTFGNCYQVHDKPLPVREEYVPGKKKITDYTYHASKKGNDIYVFISSAEEAGDLKRALIDKNINVSLIIPIGGEHRLAIPINQKKKLEAQGIEVQPYTSRDSVIARLG